MIRNLSRNIWIMYIVGIFDHLLLSITRQQIPYARHSKINWQRQLLQFKNVLMAVTSYILLKNKKFKFHTCQIFTKASLKTYLCNYRNCVKMFLRRILFLQIDLFVFVAPLKNNEAFLSLSYKEMFQKYDFFQLFVISL